MGEAQRVVQRLSTERGGEARSLEEVIPHLLALLERVDEQLCRLGRLADRSLDAQGEEERAALQLEFEQTRELLRNIVSGTTREARSLLEKVFARYPKLDVLPRVTDS